MDCGAKNIGVADNTTKIFYFGTNLVAGIGMGTILAFSSSPYAVGAGLFLSYGPSMLIGRPEVVTLGIGAGLLGRGVRNLIPFIRIARAGLEHSAANTLMMGSQLVAGTLLTYEGARQAYCIAFDKYDYYSREKDEIHSALREIFIFPLRVIGLIGLHDNV